MEPSKSRTASSIKLQHTQQQVDEVVDIMRTTVERVIERDQALTELNSRAQALRIDALVFEESTGKLRKKSWPGKLEMTIIIVIGGLVAIILIILIIMAIVDKTTGCSSDDDD